MGLDVYVGSLTRYYAGDWENVADKAARERGEPAGRRPFSDGPRDAVGIRPRILEWRRALASSLGDRISDPLEWDESEMAPYFTARPGWDGFGSLVLWAAYAEHPSLRAPPALPEAWDDDPALLRCNAEGFRSRFSHLVRNVELWLPNTFRFTFEGDDVDGRRIVVGSVRMLLAQLADLNAATWGVDDDALAQWSRQAPAPGASLEVRARYACAVMTALVRQAVDRDLPMKLDY
ncbi:hypothetical protein [Enhydrobacter sp.]|jgi:hypothetical protein|uniref:hypothetical protein n=1 Tax=Enhydrobacter sp. TaxID=1894999 RepID=UPI00262AB42A|nr:hypothetical protein [Enhydrobacter sp.]WIM12311.1 MAG: hypothetical protein OJF58_003273 [Enhydrobacter sp.]